MRAFFAVACIFLASCMKGGESGCATPDVEFEKLFMEQYVAPFRDGRASDWAKIFADDAVALHNRRPADVGHASIVAFGDLVAKTFVLAQYDVRVVETRATCDMAWSRGEYTTSFVFRETGEPAPWGPESGKFLVVWRRQPDDSWKIVADMGNANG